MPRTATLAALALVAAAASAAAQLPTPAVRLKFPTVGQSAVVQNEGTHPTSFSWINNLPTVSTALSPSGETWDTVLVVTASTLRLNSLLPINGHVGQAGYTQSVWVKGPFDTSGGDWYTLTRGQTDDHPMIVHFSTFRLGSFDNIGNDGGSDFTTDAANCPHMPTELADDEWHLITMVSAEGTTTVFWDGIERCSYAYASNSDVYYMLGLTGSQGWRIVSHEPTVWTQPLSDAQVLELYTQEVCEDPSIVTLTDTGIANGDLEMTWRVPSRSTATSFKFVGGDSTCELVSDPDGTLVDNAAVWSGEVQAGCGTAVYTFSRPVTEALKQCGFSTTPQDGGDTWYYEAVVEATTQEPNGTVFGEDTTRTVTTAFRVRVELPKSVDVSASAVAYGDVIQFALLSQQEVDTSTPTAAFKWTLVTSVQYPYELTAKEVTEESAHDFESLGLALSAASVACPASGACTQTFEITATETTSCELTDAELKSVFTIGCRSQFTGACDTPEGVETDTATFTVSTDSFCARVVEVATVTPTLTTSTSQGGASALDFVLQTTLFGRVTFAIEAGLSVTETRLLSLDLVSEESVKPVTGAGVQDSAVVSAISFLESDQGGTEPHLDFQFQLNTESVKFAVGGGQASLTITAVVEVTYDGAGSQRFEVSTEAVSGPGSVSTAASSTVGISTPAAGGSSSTAGSTVLGVSTGTAMVAGVGLVAVVALAAGAAVVARKRRASAARRLKPASSSVELNDTAAVQV